MVGNNIARRKEMKESEIINEQNSCQNEKLYLLKVGMFFHAYNAGAYAIAHLMHYKVRQKHRKCGADILISGFPAERLPVVIDSILSSGGLIFEQTDSTVVFSVAEISFDKSLEIEDQCAESGGDTDLVSVIRNFDLLNSSPMDTLNFVSRLKTMIH